MSRRGRSTDDEALIKDVVKVATLGEGSQGTVWTARLRGSRRRTKGISAAPYALKQRLIKKTDAEMRDTKSSSALREIEFYRKVANKFPNAFSKLYDWEITPASDEIKESFTAGNQDGTSLKNYTHVLTTLSARKEGVLRSVYSVLDRSQWLSMLAQVCNAIALIHERGFSHGDVWEANVAYMQVPWDRDVAVHRTTVPSCGYVWSIIDYGSVELKEDESPKERKKKRASSYELDDMISLVSGEDDAQNVCGNPGEEAIGSEFRRRVLKSVDGPSVRLAMKQTGLPLNQTLALINLDAYMWHLCGKMRSDTVNPWIDRGSLLQMSDMHASYSALATSFARLARDSVKHHG